MTPPAPGRASTGTGIHHLELWTHDLAVSEPSFGWLLGELGWSAERVDGWPLGRIWRHGSGLYLVLEQSADGHGDRHDRLAPGMNHVALTCTDREALDRLRQDGAAHGWSELFPAAYPHAGGPEHIAWYAENAEGFEVEVVASV
ncbi:VOC family protein [Brachybacterium hainanense]|uniref:VOC family protein n=1 Tax=Brachybacterium hainanense TaxID=1541174 RepID=A0ABV6RFT6_9MICO